MTDTRPTYYISITGLVLKSPWHAPQFFYHAIPSKKQAKLAPGNIYANTHYLNGYLMTMTIWENKKAMLKYMYSGAHVQAIKIFNDVASSGKLYGRETNNPDPIPWSDAYEILMAKGRDHGRGTIANNNNNNNKTPLANDNGQHAPPALAAYNAAIAAAKTISQRPILLLTTCALVLALCAVALASTTTKLV